MSDLNSNDVNVSNIKTSWRTLIEFPADKVACAIFVQETLCTMIRQKLVKTTEEIDEAMVKLYEMLKSNDEKNNVIENGENAATTNFVSERDSVKSTCGTVVQLDNVGDDEIVVPLNRTDSNEKCCQASLDFPNEDKQCNNPLELLFKKGDILNNEIPMERTPPAMCFRLNEYPENVLFENNLNLYGDSYPCVIMSDRPRNYIMVVEETEKCEPEMCQVKSRSINRSRKQKLNYKICSLNPSDGNEITKHTSRKKFSRSDRHRLKSDNHSQKVTKSTSKYTENKEVKEIDHNVINPFSLIQSQSNKNSKNSSLNGVTCGSQLIILQPTKMNIKIGFFSWMNSIYNLFVAVIEVTKSVYYRLL